MSLTFSNGYCEGGERDDKFAPGPTCDTMKTYTGSGGKAPGILDFDGVDCKLNSKAVYLGGKSPRYPMEGVRPPTLYRNQKSLHLPGIKGRSQGI
jgi:hypothetical protein